MAWAWVAMGVVAGVTAYSNRQQTKKNNRRLDVQRFESKRRYGIQSGIADQQMEEQESIAREKMTDISRAFLKAKGRATVIQAESGVGGNLEKRMKFTQRAKASEAKGKVAKEVDINNINIAQGMLAKKIDTEQTMANARAGKESVLASTVIGAVQGGTKGATTAISMGGSFAGSN